MTESDRPAAFRHDAPPARVAIAGVAGVAVALTGVSPTGNVVVDAVQTVLGVAVVVLVGARAPWWLLVAAAGIAGAVGLSVWPVVVAVAAFALAAWISPLDHDTAARADLGAVSVALTLLALASSDLDAFTGASAIAGIGVALALVVGGLPSLCRTTRRPLLVGMGVVVLVAVAATGAVAYAALGARDDLRAGVDRAREAARLTADLESEAGSAEMRGAADALAAANGRLGAWYTRPARLVPIIAQHHRAGADLTGEVAEQLDAAAADLAEISLDGLQVSGGAIDVDAVESLASPVVRFGDRIDRLVRLVDEVDSPWLVSAVRTRLDELDAELAELLPRLDDAELAVEVLPEMLGRDEPQRYLVLFTTPSEARGLGGFIGNYAVLSIDDGRIAVAATGRRSELEEAAVDAGASLSGPPGLLTTYGKFGLGGVDGEPVGPRSWSNLTLEPDWPTFATAAHELFNESHPEPVDGVVVMDPWVLGQLSAYTGPVETSDGRMLGGRELVDHLLLGQYASESRLDELEVLSARLLDAFLRTTLPGPRQLARELEPLIDEQRLRVWSPDADEQELLASVGVGDGLPDLTESDAFALAINNAAASKIDAFLRTTTDVRHVDGPDGPIVQATIELHNTAPGEGYTDYVIGNLLGLPAGTSRLYLVGYASALVDTVTVDGEPVPVERFDDGGWQTAAHYVELGPGERTTVVYEFPARAAGSAILERRQPLAARE